MTGSDIVANALTYTDRVYWYGGKDNLCTEDLLKTLSGLYPSVYTNVYISKCKKDIDNKKRCIDCSGLVCRAYGVVDLSTYGMKDLFAEWKESPLNGMILWKKTHCGIYNGGYVIEARGIDYDVTTNRKYHASDWESVLYDTYVDYGETKQTHSGIEYLKIALNAANGDYGNGDTRKKALEALGYNYDKVQSIINTAYKGE